MTSINEMSESEALEYIRAELQVLQPILGVDLRGAASGIEYMLPAEKRTR
jgi:hypothetical protein